MSNPDNVAESSFPSSLRLIQSSTLMRPLHSRMPRLRPPLTSTVWRVQHAQVLLLAVKPDMVPNVLRQISRQVTRHHLVISIAAGVTIATLQHVSTTCHTYCRPLAVGTVHPWSRRMRGGESLSRCSITS